MIEKIKDKIRLYGINVTIVLIIKAVIKKVTCFSWQKMLLLSLDSSTVNPTVEIDEAITIRELTLADYDNQRWRDTYIDEKKLDLYKHRLSDPLAHAYGAFVEGKLACSCWIYEGRLIISEEIQMPLAVNDVLFFDDYCDSNYRRRGLHNKLNKYRVLESKRLGAKKCYVIVYSYNKPALRSQQNIGMHIERSFYVFKWGKINYCTLKW